MPQKKDGNNMRRGGKSISQILMGVRSNTTGARQFFQKLKWRWKMPLLLSFVALITILLFFPDFWHAHWRFLLLDIACVPGLLIIREGMKKFWRENRWLVMSATFVLLVWVNSTWAQSYGGISNVQDMRIYMPDNYALRIAYPYRVHYEAQEPARLLVWWDCRTNLCADEVVELSTQSARLRFGLQQDSVTRWETTLLLILPGNGTAVEVLVSHMEPKVGEYLPIQILSRGQSIVTEEIFFEGLPAALERRFWVELFKSSSVVITIITAAFAALKQLDEQKRSERKKAIDTLIAGIENYSYKRGAVRAFLDEIDADLYDWDEWNPEQQENFRGAFAKFIATVIEKSRSPEHYSSETSPWTEKAEKISKKAQPEQRAAIEEIKLQKEDDSPRNASLFPPELYPLQKRFMRQAIDVPDQGEWGMSDWKMRFAPFDDKWNEQFKYKRGDDFPLLASVRFCFDGSLFAHRTSHFHNAWDLRAGYYQFCRAFNSIELRTQSRKTFFVPALPDVIPVWSGAVTFGEYLLHNLAVAWLRTLANAPDAAKEMGLWQVEALARLIVWHYGSVAAIQILSLPAETQIVRHIQATKPDQQFPASEKAGWLALRPPQTDQTLFLYAQVSPFGQDDVREDAQLSETFAKELECEKIAVARFLLADPKTPLNNVLSMTDEDLRQRFLEERVSLATGGEKHFGDLFAAHPQLDEMEAKFVARANGSPGTILRMAHQLLNNHMQKHSPKISEIDPNELDQVLP
jgi:hypothetical protein